MERVGSLGSRRGSKKKRKGFVSCLSLKKKKGDGQKLWTGGFFASERDCFSRNLRRKVVIFLSGWQTYRGREKE